MFFDFWSLVRAPAQEVPRPEKRLFRTADGDTLAGTCEGGDLLDEDLYNLPRIQAGMRSSAFRSLHLGEQEVRIRHFHRTLEGYLSEPAGESRPHRPQNGGAPAQRKRSGSSREARKVRGGEPLREVDA
jgi:hypothetical protein